MEEDINYIINYYTVINNELIETNNKLQNLNKQQMVIINQLEENITTLNNIIKTLTDDNKLKENDEIKKKNDSPHNDDTKLKEIDELKKIKEDLNNDIKQKQEEIKIQKSQRREEVKRRNQAERNLRINEIDIMTIPMLKEILINQFGYNFDRKPYIKVAELRKILIMEEGLNQKLKTPPSTPKKKRQEEIKIDYV